MKKFVLFVLLLLALLNKQHAQIQYDTMPSSCRYMFCDYILINNNYGYFYYDKLNSVTLPPFYLNKGYKILWDTSMIQNLKCENGIYTFKIKEPSYTLLKIKISDSNGNYFYSVYKILHKNEKVAFLTRPSGMEGVFVQKDFIIKNPKIGVFMNDTISDDFQVVSFCLSAYSGIGDGVYLSKFCVTSCNLSWDMLQLISTLDLYENINVENIIAKNIKTGEIVNLPPIKIFSFL